MSILERPNRIITELRVSGESILMNRALGRLIKDAFASPATSELILFQNETGYCLSLIRKNKKMSLVFQAGYDHTSVPIEELLISELLEFCAYFFSEEFATLVTVYDDMTSRITPPQEAPSQVWLRENKLALIPWIAQEFERIRGTLAQNAQLLASGESEVISEEIR